MKNYIIALIAGIFVGGFIGYTLFTVEAPVTAIATTPGNTFSNAKVAEIGFAPTAPGTNATSTSILNTDSTDRIVESAFVACSSVGSSFVANTGAGLAEFLVKMATTSTAAPSALTNTNYIANIVVATSTSDSYTATSTNPAPGPVGRLWASGSYLTIFTNATNTAQCVGGVHYLAS